MNRKVTIADIKPAKRSKYGVRNDEQGKAERTWGRVLYASKREKEVAQELYLLAATGEISGVLEQVRCVLAVNGVKICTYTADFVWSDSAGARHFVDVKGFETPVFKLKKKLMKAIHGIDVEVWK